jgi:hypothetical protein
VGARHELNKFHVIGSIGVAGLLGLVTGSWAVFAVAGVALIGVSLANGEIRPGRRWKR